MDNERIPLCDSVEKIADAIVGAAKEVGKEGASGMGALEGLGCEVRDGCEKIAEALRYLGDCIANRPLP